ncbi:MAG: hypothetical protein KAT05_03980 [Spirochaetes bacterium]|nr:hypothetical protein [Spirochaetota bacterium]
MVKKIIIIFGIMLLLISCYSHKIILNADKKSGKMIIEYNLNDDYFQLLSIAVDNFANESENPFDPIILIDEELFKQSFIESKEIKLKSVNIDTTNGYKGKIVIEFYDFEKILSQMPEGLINLNIKRKKNSLTLSQELNFNKMDPDEIFKNFILQQKEDDINFYNQLTKEAKFNFTIITAWPMKYTEGVILSHDKKQAKYSFKINDLINSNKKILKFLISL